MGAATSNMSAEPILAAVAVAGALGYGYVHYVRPVQHSDNTDDYADAGVSKTPAAVASSLHGQKKRGRKLRLPGDATLKNLDILDAPPVHASRSASTSSATGTRQRQRQQQQQQQQQSTQPHQQPQWEAPVAQPTDVLPGGFDGEVQSTDDARHVSQQQQQQLTSAAPKKPKKKKGKKAAPANPSGPSSASGASSSPLASSTLMEGATAAAAAAPVGVGVGKGKKVSVSASASAVADTHDERWTRVEARKKKAPVPTQDDAGAGVASADVTTSDAGITTSATGNSSPVTERTEDELPSELDESTMEVSAVSLQDGPPSVVPVRPLPGEQPAKGFSWEDYEGVQVDEDASGEEDAGWGVVRSRRRPDKTTTSEGAGTAAAAATDQAQSLTKKQRQNAQRREALKELKREKEAQQQAAFLAHKRELERARAAERAAVPKRTGSRFDSLGDDS